jgi:hypothetical protein
MIHKGCQYYDGDEDCIKCAKHGYISTCAGCEEEQITEREENKNDAD